ncbi:MAG: integrase DNA-binding domain-containing protein [Oscillospiraceae bacterium]|nr:integrase DNA-binding domain-containing protein [Oscillospiraceae bacterium]
MSEKRKDAKGRILYNGETQDREGRYRFRYQDAAGKRKTVYSWRLNETDPQPKGKRTCEALRTLEKQISRDLDNGINSQSASKITVNQAFENAMSPSRFHGHKNAQKS